MSRRAILVLIFTFVSNLAGAFRGGGGWRGDISKGNDTSSEEELYDEYDDESEDDTTGTVGYDHSLIDPPRSRSPSSMYNSIPRNQINREGKGGAWSGAPSTVTNTATAATKLAAKSISMTSSLAYNVLMKQPGKLAFHIIRPKHVDLIDTYGLWRLDQEIVEGKNTRTGDPRTIASVANIEFIRPKQQHQQSRQRSIDRDTGRSPISFSPPLVVVRLSKDNNKNENNNKSCDDDDTDNISVYRSPYTFACKNKILKGASLSSFQTSFVAPAFLIGENQTRLYGYKGTWQRKLADKSVIKLVGKIFQVHRQKFGKKRGEYVFGKAIGTFVMRRRIVFPSNDAESDEEEYDSDHDQYGDYGYDDDEKDDKEEDFIEFDSIDDYDDSQQ